MKETLLDTDILSYYLKGNRDVQRRVREYLRHFPTLNISVITQYEILSGLEYKRATRQIQEFKIFLTNCKVLQLTNKSIDISAKEFGRLKREGITIGNSDILIAGVAISRDMNLATNNERHFKYVNGLVIDNWKG